MRTALGTECAGKHGNIGRREGERFLPVRLADGRRYTICTHKVGVSGYCGHLIDVTHLPQVVRCCGNESEHDTTNGLPQ